MASEIYQYLMFSWCSLCCRVLKEQKDHRLQDVTKGKRKEILSSPGWQGNDHCSKGNVGSRFRILVSINGVCRWTYSDISVNLYWLLRSPVVRSTTYILFINGHSFCHRRSSRLFTIWLQTSKHQRVIPVTPIAECDLTSNIIRSPSLTTSWMWIWFQNITGSFPLYLAECLISQGHVPSHLPECESNEHHSVTSSHT